ncbi:Response regulator PleD [Thalassocella blandensis]|nr:Response regulator PleD [Thalassocella blandensis]
MPIKRALIVDDSKTAQFRLKKLLQPYQLEVDMAASAEEALGYLSYRQPVVIFMDHHMEGMDGFEALKIIKANPSTAMIPVIMYTSKTDQMYMGQAHELGAIDTISKSYMKASRIEEVLAKLDIVRDKPLNPLETVKDLEVENKEALGITTEPEQSSRSARSEAPVQIDSSELKAQIARLFEIHIADVRTQMKENTKFILRRVGQDLKEATKKEAASDVPLSVISEEVHAESTRLGLISNALLVLILVAIAGVSFQHYQSQKQLAQLEENYHYLAELNFEENLLLDKVVSPSQSGSSSNAPRNESITSRRVFDNGAMVSALNWAMNTNLLFGYNEAPLGEKNILVLQSLMYKLYNAGFKGFIDINIHFGNFCLSEAEGGGFTLADSASPISECVFADDQKIDLNVDNYTGVQFVQFEQTSPPIQNGDVEFAVNMTGFETPAVPYPQITEGLTAGEWNSTAAQNQRLTLTIEMNAE